MASPTVSYMRSLSFATAAPHHSHSAWAAASVNAAARSQQLYLSNHHSINSHNTHIYTHHLHNFNSHHDRSYAHHLHHIHSPAMVAYNSESSSPIIAATTTMVRGRPASFANPSPSGAGGRRRSSSIRSRNPPPFIKFDPFADEPTSPEKAFTSALAAQPKPLSTSNTSATSTTPYTIEIPAAVPAEMQRYAAVRSPHPSRRFSFPANDNHLGNSLGAGHIRSPIESRATVLPALSRSPPPRPPSPSLRSSPSPPPPVRQPLLSGPGTLGAPDVSKLVAGIMLNRMSVGKPLRRRLPSFEKREYVKSSLSSVVSVEA